MPLLDKPQLVTISTATFAKVVIFVVGIGFIWVIRDIILLFFIALILASIINPLAGWFHSKGVGRGMAVILLYAAILGIFVLIATTLVPAVAAEMNDLLKNTDVIWRRFVEAIGPLANIVDARGAGQNISATLGAAREGLFNTARGLVSGVVSTIIVFVVTFYLVVSEDAMRRLFRNVAPDAYQPYLTDLLTRIEKAIGAWVRGQLLLGLIVGVAVWIVLTILGVKYALVLALTAGIAEMIPYLGPILSAVPAVIIALTISPMKAVLVGVAYWIIQLLENHVLVPKVMEKAVGLHPVVCIFSLLVGAKLAGLVGALLAIPVATSLGIIISDGFRLLRGVK